MKTLRLLGPLPLIDAHQGLGGGGGEVRGAQVSGLIAPILDAAPNKKEQVKYSRHGSISPGV